MWRKRGIELEPRGGESGDEVYSTAATISFENLRTGAIVFHGVGSYTIGHQHLSVMVRLLADEGSQLTHYAYFLFGITTWAFG